jgi:hypothetical protein
MSEYQWRICPRCDGNGTYTAPRRGKASTWSWCPDCYGTGKQWRRTAEPERVYPMSFRDEITVERELGR